MEEKNDYQYLEEVLGDASWQAGKIDGGKIMGADDHTVERVVKIILRDRAQGKPGITGIRWRVGEGEGNLPEAMVTLFSHIG